MEASDEPRVQAVQDDEARHGEEGVGEGEVPLRDEGVDLPDQGGENEQFAYRDEVPLFFEPLQRGLAGFDFGIVINIRFHRLRIFVGTKLAKKRLHFRKKCYFCALKLAKTDGFPDYYRLFRHLCLCHQRHPPGIRQAV